MSARTGSFLGWLAVFAAVFAWEGVTLARRADGWASFSDVLEAVRSPVARWIAFALWLWFGWHVFVRTWQSVPGA